MQSWRMSVLVVGVLFMTKTLHKGVSMFCCLIFTVDTECKYIAFWCSSLSLTLSCLFTGVHPSSVHELTLPICSLKCCLQPVCSFSLVRVLLTVFLLPLLFVLSWLSISLSSFPSKEPSQKCWRRIVPTVTLTLYAAVAHPSPCLVLTYFHCEV